MVGKLILMLFLLGIVVVGGGTMEAIVHPESSLAVPFRGIAIETLEVTSEITQAISQTSTVTADYELKVVTDALEIMKFTEGLDKVPTVSVPTDDMSQFPSALHHLYPGYLSKNQTDYKYTVDSSGTVGLDSSARTDATFADKVQRQLDTLKKLALSD